MRMRRTLTTTKEKRVKEAEKKTHAVCKVNDQVRAGEVEEGDGAGDGQ